MKTIMLVFGTRPEAIKIAEASALLDDKAPYDTMSTAVNPYGDGLACGRIVEALR